MTYDDDDDELRGNWLDEDDKDVDFDDDCREDCDDDDEVLQHDLFSAATLSLT